MKQQDYRRWCCAASSLDDDEAKSVSERDAGPSLVQEYEEISFWWPLAWSRLIAGEWAYSYWLPRDQ